MLHHRNQIRTQHQSVRGSDLSFISALSINNNTEGNEMNRTKINETRIGRYGRKLLAYMKEYNQDLYTELLFSCGLEDWLIEQNEICKERIWEYTQELAKKQGVAEELKARDQMAWVGAMNAIRAQAEEIIIGEMYTE